MNYLAAFRLSDKINGLHFLVGSNKLFPCAIAKKGLPVNLWCHNPGLAGSMKFQRRNPIYLSDTELPQQIKVSSHLEESLDGVETVIVVVPSQYVGSVLEKAAPLLADKKALVSASKGIEVNSLRRVSQIIEGFFPHPEKIFVISGPNFAGEVARGLPAAAVVAGVESPDLANIQSLLTSPSFRVYTNNDPIGTELGGALKNVIAIACGVADGLGLGLNARSALITRGLAEISRLGKALGAEELTFWGLAGVGDLVLTCTGNLSRNRMVGISIGKGELPQEVLVGMKMVAEGVKTAQSVRELSRKAGVEMPICDEVYRILYEDKNPRRAVEDLMGRGLKGEIQR
jgi:glycerol-3-phosphate dehydrogenase (NAD(P)+)